MVQTDNSLYILNIMCVDAIQIRPRMGLLLCLGGASGGMEEQKWHALSLNLIHIPEIGKHIAYW